MSVTSIILCVVYFVILIGIGVFVGKKTKNSEDFAVAGRRIGMFVALCTIIASEWGGGNVMGTASDAYSYGISAYIFPVSMGIGILLLGLLLAKKYWNIEEISMCRYIRKRYSRRCELVATVLMLLSIMLVTASQFKSGGLLAEAMFGWSHVQAVIIFAVVVCIYTSIGGLMAVAYNDTFNLIFGGLGLLICLIAGLNRVGGFNELIAQSVSIAPERMDPRPFGSWIWAVDYLASSTFVMLAVPELIQRIWACKTEKVAKRACVAGGIVYIVLGIVSLLLGLIAFVLVPELSDAGLAMPSLIIKLFPGIFSTFLILSILAALVSTADTMLLICSTMIVEDLVLPLQKTPMDEKKKLVLLRVLVFAVGAMTAFFATGFTRVLGLVLFSYYVYIGITTAFIFGRIWKGATEKAAFWSMITSCVAAGIWEFTGMSYQVNFATSGIIAVVFSIVPFFAISLMEKPGKKDLPKLS